MAARIAGEVFLIWRLKDGGGNRWKAVVDLALEEAMAAGIAGELFLMCWLKDGGGNRW